MRAGKCGRFIRAVLVTVFVAAGAPAAHAADRFALVVTGASGGAPYAQKYDAWREALVTILRDQFGYPADHVLTLSETGQDGETKASRETVRQVLGDMRKRLANDDQLLIVLIGHGTADGEDAKFNLVGPDLDVDQWAALIRPIAGRVIFVNTTGGSSPFLQKLAGRGRVVLTATDTPAQQYESVFAEHFIKALTDGAADADRNGRVSMWEAFTFAGAGVRQWFDRQGQLPTERPLLDDNGDGVGTEAAAPGADGAVAKAVYVQPETVAPTGDAALDALVKRRAELEARLDSLRTQKPTMDPKAYEAELEKLLLEIARVAAEIRSKS